VETLDHARHFIKGPAVYKARRRPGKTRSKARSVSKRCALLRLSDLAVDLNPIGLSAGSSRNDRS